MALMLGAPQILRIPESLMDVSMEERICERLSKKALKYAYRYQNPYKWPLDLYEIYGELLVEVAKSIKTYLNKLPMTEYWRVSYTMLWNRMYELLKQAYKKNANESTAYVLEEDHDVAGSDVIFMLPLFIEHLPEVARSIVISIVEPTLDMRRALKRHIDYRNTLYKHGGGVNGIPAKVIAEAMNLSIKEVNLAFEYIRIAREIEQEVIMGIVDTDLDFANELVTWKDTNDSSRYIGWPIDKLEAQCKYRKIWEDGMKLSQMVHALREYDKKHNIAQEEEPMSEDKVDGGEEFDMEFSDEGVKVTKADSDDDEDDDDSWMDGEFGKSSSDNEEEEEEEEEEEKDDGSRLPDWLTEEIEEKEEVPEANEENTKANANANAFDEEPTNVAGTYDVETVFTQLLNNLREGESIVAQRISPAEWKFFLLPASEGSGIVAQSESVIEAKAPVPQNIEGKYKRGSKAWKQEVYDPEYAEKRVELKKLDLDGIREYAESIGAELTEHADEKIFRMRAVMAIMKKLDLEKYKKEYQNKAALEAVTI